MHHKLKINVFMINIGISEFHMEGVEHRSKITLLVDVKGATEINIEVVEIDGDSIAVWNPPSICILFGVHVERF